MKKRQRIFSLILVTLVFLLAGCRQEIEILDGPTQPLEIVDLGDDMILDMVPLADTPAVANVLSPVAAGTHTQSNSYATIDYSNTSSGYVMCRYSGTSSAKLKVQVTGPSGTVYSYNLNTDGTYETFPLSDGNGTYKIGMYQNTSGTMYTTLVSASVSVSLTDEFAPFLRPNQYVNYYADSEVVKLAAELTAGITDTLAKVEVVYNYVVSNFTYDTVLAQSVTSGYLPDVDAVLAKKKGICFDYAAVMAAMLRCQSVPTKLVVGYTGTVYHAWINVYSPESGWLDAVIYFNGSEWKLMDPTFASSSNNSQAILDYIGNGSNYTAKFLY